MTVSNTSEKFGREYFWNGTVSSCFSPSSIQEMSLHNLGSPQGKFGTCCLVKNEKTFQVSSGYFRGLPAQDSDVLLTMNPPQYSNS